MTRAQLVKISIVKLESMDPGSPLWVAGVLSPKAILQILKGYQKIESKEADQILTMFCLDEGKLGKDTVR